MDLREDDLVDPDHHWYYQAKVRAIEAEFRRHVPAGGTLLDLGAGSGFFARYLLHVGAITSAVCVDPGYTEMDLARSDGQLCFTRSLPGEMFDAVLMIDVLEHVRDDVQLFQNGVARLRVNGTFVVTVPAFASLWSSHDEYLLHFRRYRRDGLLKVLLQADVRVLALRYLFGLLFPIAFVRRRLRRRAAEPASDLREAPGWLNALLLRWFTFEHRVLPQRLFGLSVLAVGTKQG